MGIVAEDVARVREATDIVQLVSNAVALRKAGRRWQGLCPFHTEKTASFSVNAEEGLYYCFGCRASGDAITFVRETEGLDFAAAVELLAGRAGISLRYDSRGEAAQHGRRKQLVEVVAAAVDWYHERLLSHPDAGGARGYLRSRGLNGEEVRAFKVGWAPAAGDALCRALGPQADAELLAAAGLAYRRERGGVVDSFRARVLFPVFDARGDAVGFGGRILPDADGPPGPKYKNSTESSIYTKSRLLYGLNWAKEHVVRRDEVIVCEGYTDVIGLHAADLPQAVATCGTALTEEHVKLLRRFAARIVLAFDADNAGWAAAERIYQWERTHELDVRVAGLPPGADPDDLARRDPEALRELVANAKPFLEYRLDRALARGSLETPEGRVRAADAALSVVDEHPSELVRDQYLMRVADRCLLPPEGLRDAVTELRARRRRRATAPGDGGEPSGAAPATPGEPSIAEQVLLLRMHTPHEVPAWITGDLFAGEAQRRLLAALEDGVPLGEMQEALAADAAALAARLAVCEPPERAGAVIGRFVFDAAQRRIDALPREARTTGDAAAGRRWADVQRALGDLRTGDWSSPAAAERLAGLLTGEDAAAAGRVPCEVEDESEDAGEDAAGSGLLAGEDEGEDAAAAGRVPAEAHR